MRGKIALIALLFLVIGTNSFSQTNAKLYIVINHASWCKYCKAHGDRVKIAVNEFASGKEIQVILNDVTDKESQKKMEPQFKNLGLSEYMNKHHDAAIIYVFDSKTKKILDGFNIKIPNEEILTHLKQDLGNLK